MKKEISQADVRKRTLSIFCKHFLNKSVVNTYLSIADLEVKAISGLEKYNEKKSDADFCGLDNYLEKYSLSAHTLNSLYAAGHEKIVRFSYRFHGEYYKTEHHKMLNEKLGIS